MWLATSPADESLSIEFEFDHVYKLYEMLVWNYNVEFELVLGFGLKDVTVEYSENGTDWMSLGDVTLNQATATAAYKANTTVAFGGVPAKYVRMTVSSAHGFVGQYGLSEIRFLYIPAQAREPQPADGAVEVDPGTTLSWRAGREAASHEIYLGTALGDLSLVDAVGEPVYVPADLTFGSTYYWQIVEVNEADDVSAWASEIWTFSTQEYALIDGMEDYNDDIDAGTTIFDAWIDGWVNGNGSTVGYFDAPFAERKIVHTGVQSMPLQYDNTASPFYSEAQRTFDLPQDWTLHGAEALVLHYRGVAQPDTGNSTEPLYVAVEDSSGKSAVVTLPAATATPAWTQWAIPLSEFTGVNMSRIEVLTIGVGNPVNPTAGGTGIVYIDDIGYGSPATP